MQIRGCLRVEVRKSGDREIAKGNTEIRGNDGYVYPLDGDAGFIGVYGCQNFSNCLLQARAIHFKSVSC